MEIGDLAAIVMGREEVSSVLLHQGPHCPFLAETEGNQTWSFSCRLAAALAGACLLSIARSRARTRSVSTQGEDPIPQVPRYINPREVAAQSPE